MRHFKFIGGPWDGKYHEVDSETFRRGYLNVSKPPPFEAFPEDGDFSCIKPLEHTTYTLREFAGPVGNVYYFADSKWPDATVISQLVHHYPGRL